LENLGIDEKKLTLGHQVSDREAICLYSLAKKASEGAIVEIGSNRGRSTVYLAKGCEIAGTVNRVYAIDPHFDGTELIFRENMQKAGVSHIVVPMVMKSEEAAKQWHQPVSLLFIDGAHDYENVRKDFVLWEPSVITGGMVCFHDKFDEGPAKVIRNHVLLSNRFSQVGVVQGLLYAIKGGNDTFVDRLNKFNLLMWTYLASAFHLLTRLRYMRWAKRLVLRAGFGKVGEWLANKTVNTDS